VNTNALYNLGDPNFAHWWFSELFPWVEKYEPTLYHDTFISSYVVDEQNFWGSIRHVWHWFTLTNRISNDYQENLRYQRDHYPHLYLVHGRWTDAFVQELMQL